MTDVDRSPSLDGLAATARALYDALAAGDAVRLDGLLSAAFSGDVTRGLPLGLGGLRSGPTHMRDATWWPIGRAYEVRAEPDDLRLLDDGRLYVAGHYRGSGRRGGTVLDAAFVHVLTFDADGRISSLVQLTDSAAWVDALAPLADAETLRYAVKDGVATLTLNRPEVRNAIDDVMAHETLLAAQAIESDPSVRAVLIRAEGPAFTVGGDLRYLARLGDDELPERLASMTTHFHDAFRILGRIDAPVVAAVQGAVAGGGMGYAFAADVVVAEPGTVFVSAFADVGVAGDGGGTWHLPRKIGLARATRMYLENTPVDAETALEWGLISEIVPRDELDARAAGLARRFAAGPTRAYGAMRALLRDSLDHDLSTQLAAETSTMRAIAGTRDARTGIRAFAAGERPAFEGR
jgi:2-(1,2-epoxy-1,2-dihydrophenyl)acetyl-CoA isomerase